MSFNHFRASGPEALPVLRNFPIELDKSKEKEKKERIFCKDLLRTTTNELFLRKMGGEWHFVLFVKNSNTKILRPRTKCGCRA